MSLTVNIKKRLGEFTLDVVFETDGGISGLLGASGSGKSMTLMCIAGIVKPDSGLIRLNGRTLFNAEEHINLTPQQRHVGYLFQSYALFPNMTVRQNIVCGLCREKEKTERERAYRDMIEMMQLEGLEKHRPGQLSGGQQQRVALARILIGNPELLVLDEPFSALDSHLREKLQLEILQLLRAYGKDTLLVTHSRDEAYQLCGDIALFDSGRIVTQKETKKLFADPGSRHAAIMTGCKNVVGVRKAGENLVEVPEWGVIFNTSGTVGDNIRAIGIRAHYFDPDNKTNRFPVRFTAETERPFENSIQFRYKDQLSETQDIWWLVPKDGKEVQLPSMLGVPPESIMLLY